MALLEVKNITKRFGGLVAVKDFSLDVDRGQIMALAKPQHLTAWLVFTAPMKAKSYSMEKT